MKKCLVRAGLSGLAMVSIIAKKIAIKRQYNGWDRKFDINGYFISVALCEVFDRADITRDGTISIAEYMALCEEYGVILDEGDVKAINDIADDNGEIHRMDFILHIKSLLKLA